MQLFNIILRLLFNASSRFIGPKDCIVETYEVVVNNINIRVYKGDASRNRTDKPVILYYHGGGWFIGSIKAYDRILRFLSYNTNCIVVAVEYRKSPEHKFPIALEDAYTGYNWAVNNISKFHGDISRLIFCGDSAGGNLALGLIKMLDTQTDIMPYLLVLIYPLVEPTIIPGGKIRKANLIYRATERLLKYSLRQYLINYEQCLSPYISHISNFDRNMPQPMTLVITCELDALTPTINKYVEKLKSIGTAVMVKEYPGVLHGFINFSGVSKQGEHALRYISSYIKINTKP